ncbi:hypothetical protein ACFY2V_33305 [Streptomyces eurythermus]|uniref:hypothetical protein n=1 Tax=Streptomyces eurythermus TaxID=42237 RepID=UPI0036A926F0
MPAKAFTELGVRMVWAETMSVNRGSRNIVEKLDKARRTRLCTRRRGEGRGGP